MPPRTDYATKFKEILDSSAESIAFDDLIQNFNVKSTTVKKHLKEFISENPAYLSKLIGIYPDAATVISLAEQQLGVSVGQDNLFLINKKCKEIIDSITKPIHRKFLNDLLIDYKDESGRVNTEFDTLLDLLYDNYSDFIGETGNSLVSIAGRLNEEILLKGLESVGLVRDNDFVRKGGNSDADLKVFHRSTGGDRKILFGEIKSYHARERFLRGLRDIPHPEKIGIGFFIDPREFNPKRTEHYVRIGTWAIYLPDETHDSLNDDSKSQTSVIRSKLYRPLSIFCDDMKYFCANGELRPYS